MAEETEKSPLDQLKESIKGFPSEDRVEAWKAQVPGRRIKLFCPDGKRVFFLRGVSGLEMATIQKQIVQNSENPEQEIMLATAAKCVLWTNITPSGTLDEATLRTGPAGLPPSLFEVVQNLSDFYSPSELFQLSLEL